MSLLGGLSTRKRSPHFKIVILVKIQDIAISRFWWCCDFGGFWDFRYLYLQILSRKPSIIENPKSFPKTTKTVLSIVDEFGGWCIHPETTTSFQNRDLGENPGYRGYQDIGILIDTKFLRNFGGICWKILRSQTVAIFRIVLRHYEVWSDKKL